MKLAIACDHGALALKDALVKRLEGQGFQVGLDGLLHLKCAVIAGNGNFHW